MKKIYSVVINEFSEQDFEDIFYQATSNMGIEPGHTIPSDILNLKYNLMRLLFRPELKEKVED
jgi:uncharacterized protein YukJ